MTSPWNDAVADVSFAPLSRDVHVDVAVVGGGIAGLTAAFLLKKAGKKVALLESKAICSGETARTTAHLTAVMDVRYHQLVSMYGRGRARRIAESNMAAIAQIESIARELGVSCDFERLPGYLYTEDSSEVSRLEQEVEAARMAGLDATLTREVPAPISVAAAVRYANQARFHPKKYAVALASAISGNGSEIFEQTHVTQVHDGKPCRIETEHGTVTATDVVIATDSPICNRVFLHTKISAYRSYVVAGWTDRDIGGLLWDTMDPYHYIRTHPFDGGNLLIIGGKDHKVGEKEDTEEVFTELEQYARERFGLQTYAYRWSGQVEEPVDGLPYIGRNSLSRHLYVATGFAGTGMTGGTLSGMILRDLIDGRSNPWAQLYSATRVRPLLSARRYVEENVDFPTLMVKDRVTGAQVDSVEEIPRGEGRIARVGNQRLAVYRDEGGKLEAVSPVCTHLGCYVHFNNAEKSWDCPCHGSRFGTSGEVLHGPARDPLQRVALTEDEESSPVATDEEPTRI